jgi:hypothetical protein
LHTGSFLATKSNAGKLCALGLGIKKHNHQVIGMAKSTKVLSLTEVAALCGVSQPYISKMLDWGKLSRPLTEARVKAQWSAYEKDKRKRAKARAAPAELASALADERARSLELRTGLLNRTFLDIAKVASDLDKFIAATRNGMYGAVANLPIPEREAGRDAADLIMGRIAIEAGRMVVGLGGEEVPADPTDEERVALLDVRCVPAPAALPEPAVAVNGRAREARSRLLWRRTRNNMLEASTVSRSCAETMLREYAAEARKELIVADIGAPVTGVIEALDALSEQIINDWRAGVEDDEGDEEEAE